MIKMVIIMRIMIYCDDDDDNDHVNYDNFGDEYDGGNDDDESNILD